VPVLKMLCGPLCLALPLAAQAPLWTFHEVPGATRTALAVRWNHGFDDDRADECGAARVLAECRLLRARAAAAGPHDSGLQVHGDASVVFVVVAAADWQRGLSFVQALLDDASPLADDDLALAVARTALAADDAAWLYPGPVLGSRARQALLAGTPGARAVAGTAAAVQALGPERVRELLRQPVAVACVAVGAVPEALRSAGASMPPCAVAERGPAGPAPVGQPGTETGFPTNPRIDAPFVAAAFRVPAPDRLPAFALGLEVARMRAVRSMPPRGEEGLGLAPVVGWSWLAGDPVVLFCRRAKNGGAPDAARAELEGFLSDLRARPPSAAELDAARRSLQGEFALGSAAAGAPKPAVLPAALPGRACLLLLAKDRGIDGAAIAAATGAAVHSALVEALPAVRPGSR